MARRRMPAEGSQGSAKGGDTLSRQKNGPRGGNQRGHTEQFATSILSASGADGKSLDDLALDFAARVLAAERLAVSAGWHDPVAMHDAAVRHGLGVRHFVDDALGAVFHFVCIGAETGINPSLGACLHACRCWNVPLIAWWLRELIAEGDPDFRATVLPQPDHEANVAEVVRLADIRERQAPKLLTALGRLLVDTDHYSFIVTPKNSGPLHARRPGKRKGRSPIYVG